jgi:hypothetical protein
MEFPGRKSYIVNWTIKLAATTPKNACIHAIWKWAAQPQKGINLLQCSTRKNFFFSIVVYRGKVHCVHYRSSWDQNSGNCPARSPLTYMKHYQIHANSSPARFLAFLYILCFVCFYLFLVATLITTITSLNWDMHMHRVEWWGTNLTVLREIRGFFKLGWFQTAIIIWCNFCSRQYPVGY